MADSTDMEKLMDECSEMLDAIYVEFHQDLEALCLHSVMRGSWG